ncbi:hypothetical protein GRB29_09225 [Streptococcus pneumoniae]|nr:hypothetical protein [Streptococcus pneumoniae]
MLDVKQKALDKMLREMNKDHSPAEDAIHNWISDQNDERLFKGVLDEKKSIKEALKYCANQAQKIKVNNCAMVDDKTVYGWVYKYFTGKIHKVDLVQASVTVGQEPKKPTVKKTRKTKYEVDGQLDLFGGLV